MSAELGAHEEDGFAQAAQAASLELSLHLLLGLALSLLLASLAPLALAGPLALGLLLLRLRAYTRDVNPLPNLITALRVVLTGLMALGVSSDDARPYALLVLAIFTLDGIDGTLARRLSASSRTGGRFDMESDGYLVLMLCSLLAARGVGAWILTGGLLRYAYVIATSLFPSRGEAPPSRFGRYAFSLALTALTLALVAGKGLDTALALFATGVLVWSFGRSFYWAFRAPG